MRKLCAVFLLLFVVAQSVLAQQTAVERRDSIPSDPQLTPPGVADTLTREFISAPPESPAESLIRALSSRRPAPFPHGTSGPDRGVTWSRPPTFEASVQDLWEMWHSGVTAVRTGIIRDERILTFADTIGLRFYIDLPVRHLAAPRVLDTLGFATALVDTIAGLARRHRSIKAIGLASYSETTDSTACEYFRRLSRRADAAGGLDTYYVTTFVAGDQCADAVDLVLIDVRDQSNPMLPLRRWARGGKDVPFGIAALGVWVRTDTLSGLNVPMSPERQARYFEENLPVLLSDTMSVRPRVVFVHGWRDHKLTYAAAGRDLIDPFFDHYGLHTAGGAPRPALDVVKGIYTGSQTVFAFKGGKRVSEGVRWPTPLGWGVILLLGTFFALSPRFRHMIPRYFRAHFFYREAVREGRDVQFGASAVLLTSLGAAAGIITAVVLSRIKDTEAFVLALSWLDRAAQNAMATLASEPLILTVLVGCVYALATILWTVVLSLVSRRKYRISPGQGLMLIVWPLWPLLLVMLAAMVIANEPTVEIEIVLGLAAAWLVISVFAMLRTTFDFALVTRVPVYMLIPVLLFHPGVIAVALAYLFLIPEEAELNFLWTIISGD